MCAKTVSREINSFQSLNSKIPAFLNYCYEIYTIPIGPQSVQNLIIFHFIAAFIIATQFFYTVAFILTLIAFGLSLLYGLCCGPDQNRFVKLIGLIGLILLAAGNDTQNSVWNIGIKIVNCSVGLSAAIAVIVFASLANRQGWMPGQRNNFFGWSFGLAVAGVFASIVAGTLFLIEMSIQKRRARDLRDSQARFSIEETKA